MKYPSVVVLCCLSIVLSICPTCDAGRRAPGEYCGIPLFDRWDGCTLYSGIYVMYVAEDVKAKLRPYAGEAIQIDAKEVVQPMNPGDGVIEDFEYLGAAPESPWAVSLKGLVLSSSVKVREDGKPVATMTIHNASDNALSLRSDFLAPTVLTKCDTPRKPFVSNGSSFAAVTRRSLYNDGDNRPIWKGQRTRNSMSSYAWSIGKENALPSQFRLGSKKTRTIDIELFLPDGQYEFLCGYGGGTHASKCFASNLSAFDVKDGKAKVIVVKNR